MSDRNPPVIRKRSERSGDRVRDYFRGKTRQLRAVGALVSGDHSGLAGSHREELHRIYLREILPRRFAVGRGIVYGFAHRSREADVVIWDSENFPSLPMLDHSFFFAESVRVVLESKSQWSDREFRDVLKKARAVRDIIAGVGPSLADQIDMLRLDVAALRAGVEHEGMLLAKHHIGTAAVFLRGGKRALRPESISHELLEDVDDEWPDLVLLLAPGRLVVKDYPLDGGTGHLLIYELGEDALLAFTHGLLLLLEARSVQTEEPLFLGKYVPDLTNVPPVAAFPFRLTRMPPQRVPLWR